jgi:hypothetical protein
MANVMRKLGHENLLFGRIDDQKYVEKRNTFGIFLVTFRVIFKIENITPLNIATPPLFKL